MATGVSNLLSSLMGATFAAVEENKELVALGVGLWTYREMKRDAKRLRGMSIKILAPPFTIGSDRPMSAGAVALTAAFATLAVIQKNFLPLLAVA